MSQLFDEAAHWFAARRRGVMTLEERTAFDAWMAHGSHRAAMSEMEAVWSVMEGARPHALRAQDVARKMMVAAACALTIGIGILSYTGDGEFWTTLDWTNR